REKENRKRQQIVELKELQLTCNIGEHDFNTKINHSMRFLDEGNKVKVLVKFKGREMAHTERGIALLNRFAETVSEISVIEKLPLLDGRNMIMILGPKKVNLVTKGKQKNEQEQDQNTQSEREEI
ncbi:MAG: translation initiation factor IF-3, partial [Clostridia bacterium]